MRSPIPQIITLVATLIFPVAEIPSRAAQPPSSQPFTYQHEIRTDPPMHLHIVRIDLTTPGVSIHVARAGPDPDGPGQWTTKLQTVRSMAEREHFDIAVNGDFFFNGETKQAFGQLIKYPEGSPAQPVGPAMSDGLLWNLGSAGTVPALVVTKDGRLTFGEFSKRKFPPGTTQITSGNLLLNQGQALSYKDSTGPAPHTAVGIDKDQKTLTLLVVDGRRPTYSAGLTRNQMTSEMQRLGCHSALNLDGGGSSTLVVRHPDGTLKVMNRPSDGYQALIPLSIERPVASALGIRFNRESRTSKP